MTVRVTYTGRAIARSGLLPLTAHELLVFLGEKVGDLKTLNQNCADSELADCDDFAFVLLHAAYSSAEYGRGPVPRRYLPYQLLAGALTGPQGRVRHLLFQPSEINALNGAILAWRWISGVPMRQLEAAFDIRSGVLSGMFADAANIIRCVADILYATTAARSADELPSGITASAIETLRELVPAIRRVATRLDHGLPDEVLWLRTLSVEGTAPLLSRHQAIGLREAGLLSPLDILDPSKFPQLLDALGPRSPTNTALAQTVQQATRTWRQAERIRLIESQRKRLPVECRDLLLKFYRTRETEFEVALAEIFACFSINIDARDDGTVNGFPDFVISPVPPQTLAIECKSKTTGDSVTFNDATDVIRKAGVNGYKDAFKVTVCQPYISPDVPRKLANCPDLSVVNVEDLAEAFVRLKTGSLTTESLVDWLGRPGQALREHLLSAATPVVL